MYKNCKANCLQVPAQKDELEENTKMYSSEWNMIQEEEEEQQQNMTRINRRYSNRISSLLNEEDFGNARLDPKTIDLSFH